MAHSLSLNQVVLEMLGLTAGSQKRRPADALRKLTGGWTENEASEFNDAIKICAQIDEEMWR